MTDNVNLNDGHNMNLNDGHNMNPDDGNLKGEGYRVKQTKGHKPRESKVFE